MVEPGTAAIATLATLAGVSGYGAMKLNSNQDVVIEQKVQDRIAATQERLKEVEAAKAKQDAELAALQKELEMLRQGKTTLEQTPAKKNSFMSHFFPTAKPEREFTPAFAAPGDVTTEIVPEPVVPAPEPVLPTSEPVVPAPEPVVPTPEPVVPAPEPVPESVVPGVNFPPEPKSQGESKTEETDRVQFAPTVSRSLPKVQPPVTGIDFTIESPGLGSTPTPPPYRLEPSLESPVKALTATVPQANRKLPPTPPLSTRRRKTAGLRKKKLRTRRGGKQKNVGRTRSR